jgi:hypothetical protein
MVSVFDIIQDDGNDGEGKDRKAKKMQTARVEEIHVSRCTGDVRLFTCVVPGYALFTKRKNPKN